MCDECEYHGNCRRAALIAREVLRTGNFGRMAKEFDARTRECDLFLLKERRRYA